MPMSLIYLAVSMSEHASLSCNLAACSPNLMPSLSQRLSLWILLCFSGRFPMFPGWLRTRRPYRRCAAPA
jgi:hypothetical protein